MKYDYTVQTIYGIELSADSLPEAKRIAKGLLTERPDCDPVIDQYYKDDELTGDYWTFKNGKCVKAAPPISLKGFIR